MKLFNGPKTTFLAFLGLMVMPFLAMASGAPHVVSASIQGISRNTATIVAQYDGDGIDYQFGNAPTIFVQYVNTATGTTMVTPSLTPFSQTGSVNLGISKLDPGTTYSYTVDVSYNGVIYATAPQKFTTQAAPVQTDQTLQYTFGTTPAQTTPALTIITPEVQTVADALGVSTVRNAVASQIRTSETIHKNGVVLAITDDAAHVTAGESITYRIQYSNTHGYTLTNSQIVVKLPPQYQFTNGSNATYDDTANTVTIYLGDVPANSTNTVKFTARAVGQGNATLTTTATLKYDHGSISATDVNHYQGGSQSLLGASVFGAGFFPQTLWGWLGIILLIAVIVIVARRYMTNPKPNPPAAPKAA